MSVDAAACREHLAHLLDQEIAALEELTRLLAHEHELLAANAIDALESAMDERQKCVGKLLRLEDERQTMCRMLGHEADQHGLERLMAWCDPQGTLRPRWEECAERAARCREQNDRNGALVTARLRRVESLLHVLTGQPAEGRTYGPKGAQPLALSGRVLTVEA